MKITNRSVVAGLACKVLAPILLSALASLAIAPAAEASPISVPNYSFETPVYGAGGFGVIGSPWLNSGPAGGLDGAFATPTQGEQTAFVGTDNAQAASIYQDIGTLLPLKRYTLTVDVIPRSGFVGSKGWIELVNGTDPTGTLLSQTFVTESPTTFTATTSFLTGPTVGGDLTIVLGYDNTVNGQMIYDNVCLDAVPEPASLGLLAVGGLALLKRRRATGC